MDELDADDAAARQRLGQLAALPVLHAAAVVPVEARQRERLAVHLFDLGDGHADADAVGGGPGRLILRSDRRLAASLLVTPDDFELGLRVVRIEHAGPDLLAFRAVDVLVDDGAAA